MNVYCYCYKMYLFILNNVGISHYNRSVAMWQHQQYIEYICRMHARCAALDLKLNLDAYIIMMHIYKYVHCRTRSNAGNVLKNEVKNFCFQ